MNRTNALLAHLSTMSTEQLDNLTKRISLLEKVASLDDAQALYTDTFLGKLFFPNAD